MAKKIQPQPEQGPIEPIIYAPVPAIEPSVKAKVIGISRDYLTLEFEPGQQIAFAYGQSVVVSKI